MSRLQLLYTQGILTLDDIESINRGLKKTATAAPAMSQANGTAFQPASNQ